MFDTIEAAIEYLKGVIADYYNKGPELQTLYQQARQNLYDAYNTGDSDIMTAAQDNLEGILQMIDDYNSTASQLAPIANYFNVDTHGLGFAIALLPIIYAVGGVAVVIGLATAVYVFYQNYQLNRDKFNQVTQMVQQGQITPQEALQSGALTPSPGILSSLSGLASSGTGLLLVGGFLFLALRK